MQHKSTREKLSSLANQFPTPMCGSYKDVLLMEKSETREEGKACVQFAICNSSKQLCCIEFRAWDMKATLDSPETKRR